MTWSEKYPTGIVDLDDQHKEVITAIEDLDRNLNSNAFDTEITVSLTALLEQLKDHFRIEEQYMAGQRSPDIPAHKKEHDEFLNLVNEQLEAHRSHQRRFDAAVLGVIRDWMINHFEGMDSHPPLSVMNATPPGENAD